LNRESKADRLALLNALASMYTQLARKEKDNKKREEYYNQATQHYNQADRIDVHEEQTWIGKGVTYLARGQTERAEFQFETVLQQNSRNIAAQLGKASVQMEKKNYHHALASYSAVVEQLGSVGQGQYASHDEVEAHRHVFTTALLGLGEAYWRLNHHERARACFERAGTLDDSLALPLVYRALLDLNVAARHDAQDKSVRNRYVVSAMQLFKRAYDLHAQNSVVLNHLSAHLFSKRDYDKARTLALQAYHQTNQKRVQAEACYNIGRTYHAEDNLDQAFKYYTQAIQLWPDYVLALYTLAQLYIARSELDKATDLLDKATKHQQSDTTEVIKLLAELCAAREDETRALNLLKRVTSQIESRDTADVVLWLARAQLTQRHDPHDALVAYQRARDLLGMDKDESSALTNQTLAVLNNSAVLKHLLHDEQGAELDLKRALSADEEQWMTPARVTLAYNLARLWEDEHNTRRASELYKRILKDHPAYLECYFRLGLMARARGDILEAGEWFKEPMSVQPNDLGAWTLWANMNLDKGELNTAQKKFERVLAVDKNEPYANVQLATVYATAAHQLTVSDSTSETRRDKHLKNALDFYHRSLKQDPSNIYAAVGVAMVFAERKEYATAIDLFNRIREQITAANKQSKTQWDIEEPHLNLAHCYMHTKQHEKAVLLYEVCSSKFHNSKDATRLLYLAHAYFKNEQYEHCFRALNKALFLGPQLLDSWYGMAVCLKEFGGRTLTQIPRGTVSQGALLASIGEVRHAIKSLEVAAPIFERLHSMKDERSKRMFSTTKCALYERICSNNVEQLREALHELEKKLTEAEHSARERQEKARQFKEQQLRNEEEKMRVEEELRAQEEVLAQKKLEESRQLKEQYKRLQEQEEQFNNMADDDEGRKVNTTTPLLLIVNINIDLLVPQKRGKKKKRAEDDEEEIVYDNSAPEYTEPTEPLTAEQKEGRRTVRP
jgi:RNA polymerase-associated protein CTR9